MSLGTQSRAVPSFVTAIIHGGRLPWSRRPEMPERFNRTAVVTAGVTVSPPFTAPAAEEEASNISDSSGEGLSPLGISAHPSRNDPLGCALVQA